VISIEMFLIILIAILCIAGWLAMRWKNKTAMAHHVLTKKYAEKEMHYRALAENSPDMIVRYDLMGRRTYVNQTYQRITGIPLEELLGKTITENSVVSGPAAYQLRDNIFTVFKEGVETSYEVMFNVNGREYFYDYRCIPEKDANGRVHTVLAVGRDITAYKELELQLQDLAKTDVLTGILNRRSFMERVTIELASVKRYQVQACLLLIDIDYFKRINDTHGHAAGDATLAYFANLIKSKLRTTDIFGRLGGEEFAILVHLTPFSQVLELAERLRELVASAVMTYERKDIKFTMSVGVTNLSKADIEISEALGRADKALYEAKHRGRNQVKSLQV
jgi:diguanylate cyclase (GGDEF)-like protein/PAS domain S-box-containing protein